MQLLPPGRFGLPIIGETYEFLVDPQFVEKRYRQYGPIFKTRILGRRTVMLVGPEAVEFVLSKGFENFSWEKGWPLTFKILLGRSLFLMDGDEHRRNRKLIMPAFYGPALARYLTTMETIAEHYLQRWTGLGEFPWFLEFKKFTFDVASQIFLGSAPGDETDRLSQLFTTLTNGLFGPGLIKAIRARNQILKHLDGVIRDREQNPTDDALSLLLQARDEKGDRLSFEEIRAQAVLMLFAGHETTTALLTWICLELARHPDVWERARQEQMALGGAIGFEQLSQMPYLDQILSEAERLHPPVPGGFRGVVKPVEWNGFHIPQGWMAQYSILLTHYLPEVYPEPEQFNPDRFAPNNGNSQQKPFSLVGFGGGARVCIGMAFAKMELKLMLAHLIRDYQWEIMPNQSLEVVIVPTRRPKDNFQVRFWKR